MTETSWLANIFHGFPELFTDRPYLWAYPFLLFSSFFPLFIFLVPCGRLSWLLSAFERTLKLYLMSYSVSSSGEIEAVYSFTFVSFHLRLEIKLRYWLRIALPSSRGISGLTGVARIFVWGGPVNLHHWICLSGTLVTVRVYRLHHRARIQASWSNAATG